MKAQLLHELTALVNPYDSPRTEAALLLRVREFEAADFLTLAEQIADDSTAEIIVQIVFLRWSEMDKDAATRMLPKLHERTACVACTAMATRLVRHDAASARRWAVSLSDVSWKTPAPLEMRPGLKNPFSHLIKRFTGEGSPVEVAVWETIVRELCGVTVEEAVEAWREANAAGVTCPRLVPEIVRAMAEKPDMALSFIRELGDGAVAVEALAAHLQNVASRSPEEALRLIAEMEAGRDRDQLLTQVIHGVPALVGKACSLYSEEASDYEFSGMKQSMVALGTEGAVQQMVDFPALISWTRQAWEVFLDLLGTPEKEAKVRALLDRSLPGPILSGAASALATHGTGISPKESAELLRRYGPADDYVVQCVAKALAEAEGMEEAAAFIRDMPGEVRFAFNGALEGAIKRNPKEAIEWCRLNWDAERLCNPLEDAMWKWLHNDKAGAISWALDHPDAAWRQRLLRIIIEHEAHQHPQNCAAMILGELRENSAAAAEPLWVWLTALVCTQWREVRVREALEWTHQLPDSPAKAAAEKVVSGTAHCADYRLQDEEP